MAYVDQAYYTTTFGGDAIPTASQVRALEFASDLVDAATRYRIPDAGFSTLTTFRQDKVKRACCMIAEDAYAAGALSGGPVVTGFSLGDFSIQAQPGGASIGGVPVREAAIRLLNASGLTYAGVV